ncbi:hypothetical protein [Actinophytocola gossypii]|uniref:Uncharacterized protein n=1 Tax=Actinophytocola gossypii TaxID=2812003 RepID=A0ABT2JF99_9PSEU|nr:hypothetical protein [Actinophytocola gossypii]MCT2586204.1 hypothetical protein [Actinophytocola gossypii]
MMRPDGRLAGFAFSMRVEHRSMRLPNEKVVNQVRQTLLAGRFVVTSPGTGVHTDLDRQAGDRTGQQTTTVRLLLREVQLALAW